MNTQTSRQSAPVDRPCSTSFTPGPWHIVRSQTCGHLRAAHNYRSDKPTAEFTDADIRLIESAPDLLAALRQCLINIEQSEVTHNRNFGDGNVARDAIEKATGIRPLDVT